MHHFLGKAHWCSKDTEHNEMKCSHDGHGSITGSVCRQHPPSGIVRQCAVRQQPPASLPAPGQTHDCRCGTTLSLERLLEHAQSMSEVSMH